MPTRRDFLLAAHIAVLAPVACRDSPTPAPSATVAATPSAPDATTSITAVGDASADAAAADPLDEKLRHCPTTVDGSKTKITDVVGGVELIVTAAAGEAVAEIRRRAHHMEDFTRSRADAAAHGNGAGGGWMRNCPVVTKATLISAADVSGGSRILVRPIDATALVALRADVRHRWDALNAATGDQ